jgi:hypothetical protein
MRDRELRVKVSLLIRTIGWVAVQHRIEEAAKDLPIVKAVHEAVNMSSSVESSSSSVTQGDVEDMFK